ncbi:putative ribonuclease H-like domain-containing protein [Tanacetum coccineum]
MRPVRCPVTILNTKDHLGKSDGKADEDFFIGDSLNSKAFRVFNSRTRIVEENLHIRFSESTPNVTGSGPDWLFDIALTRTMNYESIVAGTQSNGFAGTKSSDNEGQARKETEPVKDYILLPLWTVDPPFSQDPKSSQDDGSKPSSDDGKKVDEDLRKDSEGIDQEKEDNRKSIELPVDLNMPALEDYSIFDLSSDDQEDGEEADINNLDTSIQVSPIPTIRIHKDHPLDQVIGDLQSATQTRRMSKNLEEHGFFRIDYDEVFAPVARIEAIRLFLAYALFKDFVVYQMDVKSVFLYGKIEEDVYVCQSPGFEDPDFSDRVYKVEKALYGQHQAPRAWYETLSTYCWTMGFKEGKLTRPYSLEGTKMSYMGELTFFLRLQVQQKKDGIFISQDKYVGEILKKFRFTKVKTASTPIDTQKPLLKDEDGEEVDVYMYRSMIGSLIYLTSSRPDIMFAVCACARYQVNLKVLHLHAVKRIFRHLKGQPKLGLWYPKDSPFDLVAYTDSDYAGASLDRKSTTGGCQFLGSRLISWQRKKQTLVANSITEAEYLQAIVDRKKIIITESTVRRDLQLEDAEGVDCLPNATIFEQLTLMSSNTTAWNEFSSTMASAIICLPTNQKFHFLKYIFESMVKNLDNVGKFLMYLRFVQVFLDKQLEGMATHNGIYIAPSHTKKIFGNMRRVGKGFSGKETPLFQIMVIQDQAEVGEGSENPTDPHHIPTIIQTSTSQPQKKQKPRKPKRKDTQIPQSSGPIDNVADEAVNEEMDDSLVRAAITANSLDAEQDRGNINKTQSKATPNEVGSQRTTSGGGPSCEDSLKLEELMAICINLQQRVLDLETIKTTQANEIASLKRRVKKLKRRNKSRTYRLKRLYKVGLIARVESSEDEGLGEEDTSKQGRIFDIDADEDITLVNDQDDADMFGVNDLDGNEVIVDNVEVVKTATTISVANTILVSAATTTTTTITEVEITLAQELAKLKSAKAKADKVVIQEPEQVTTATTLTTTIAATTITAASTRPKAKGIVIQEQDQAPTPTVSS